MFRACLTNEKCLCQQILDVSNATPTTDRFVKLLSSPPSPNPDEEQSSADEVCVRYMGAIGGDLRMVSMCYILSTKHLFIFMSRGL
jgi:hypothetical protein